MSSALSAEHPYWYVKSVIKDNGKLVSSLELSYYEYVPQSLVDTRICFSISAQDFLDDKNIQEVIKCCPKGYELAMHSRVKCIDGGVLHIPMIDMSTGSAAQLLKLKPFLGHDFEKFSWYRSGRSYHGYGGIFIKYEEWISMMGRLLLANQIGMPPTVDPRWVGHRLISGYAALRWTKNTDHYIDLPRVLTSSSKKIN